MILAGYANNDIAKKTYKSVNTIKVTVSRIYKKLMVNSRIELANFVKENNFDL